MDKDHERRIKVDEIFNHLWVKGFERDYIEGLHKKPVDHNRERESEISIKSAPKEVKEENSITRSIQATQIDLPKENKERESKKSTGNKANTEIKSNADTNDRGQNVVRQIIKKTAANQEIEQSSFSIKDSSKNLIPMSDLDYLKHFEEIMDKVKHSNRKKSKRHKKPFIANNTQTQNTPIQQKNEKIQIPITKKPDSTQDHTKENILTVENYLNRHFKQLEEIESKKQDIKSKTAQYYKETQPSSIQSNRLHTTESTVKPTPSIIPEVYEEEISSFINPIKDSLDDTIVKKPRKLIESEGKSKKPTQRPMARDYPELYLKPMTVLESNLSLCQNNSPSISLSRDHFKTQTFKISERLIRQINSSKNTKLGSKAQEGSQALYTQNSKERGSAKSNITKEDRLYEEEQSARRSTMSNIFDDDINDSRLEKLRKFNLHVQKIQKEDSLVQNSFHYASSTKHLTLNKSNAESDRKSLTQVLIENTIE